MSLDVVLVVDRDGSYLFYTARPMHIRVVDHGLCETCSNDVLTSCEPIIAEYHEDEWVDSLEHVR